MDRNRAETSCWAEIGQLTHDDSHVAGQQLLHDPQSDAAIASGDDSNAVRLFIKCLMDNGNN